MPKVRRKYPDQRVHPAARPKTCPLAGKVMWLPKRGELQCDLGIEDGCYNHPVVVLSPFPESEKVVVLLITSLNGRALKDCHWKQDVRAAHLPVHPCDPHPDSGKLLHLESNLELRKKSYVKTTRKIRVPLDCLQSYHGPHSLHWVFSVDSYKELMESAQFQPPMASPSQARLSHPDSPELSWSNGSGLYPPSFPTLSHTSHPIFTHTDGPTSTEISGPTSTFTNGVPSPHPGRSHQVQHAHRVNPVPITFTYTHTAAARPEQYISRPPRLPARSSPSAFQVNPYSNVEPERQIRAIPAARAKGYGTIIPSNTNRNTRLETRRSTGHLPLSEYDEWRAANATGINQGCGCVSVFFIICIIFMIGFSIWSAANEG
ncbi:hypothetical protein B0J13DRAFT_532658 [Dactylonectria estremocensis]|uniref:Uncharacterized protein n=1 Tax=Dactylonectria estremocensis TaxID=1079267 RepID=A0A9P9IGL0_9HYPO|nr:hypothetical protein B0J13DRAFT_532658 [Dactylonectria estremocensis]